MYTLGLVEAVDCQQLSSGFGEQQNCGCPCGGNGQVAGVPDSRQDSLPLGEFSIAEANSRFPRRQHEVVVRVDALRLSKGLFNWDCDDVR